MAKPSLMWPAIYIAGAIIWLIKSAAFPALIPLFLFILAGAVLLYRQTIADREQWRHDRLVAWIKRPLPEEED